MFMATSVWSKEGDTRMIYQLDVNNQYYNASQIRVYCIAEYAFVSSPSGENVRREFVQIIASNGGGLSCSAYRQLASENSK